MIGALCTLSNIGAFQLIRERPSVLVEAVDTVDLVRLEIWR